MDVFSGCLSVVPERFVFCGDRGVYCSEACRERGLRMEGAAALAGLILMGEAIRAKPWLQVDAPIVVKVTRWLSRGPYR